MPKYAVAVLVTVEADDDELAIEKVSDVLKGNVLDASYSRVVPVVDERTTER